MTVVNNSAEPLEWELALEYERVNVTVAWDASVESDDNVVLASGDVLEPGAAASFGYLAVGSPFDPLSCTVDGAECELVIE